MFELKKIVRKNILDLQSYSSARDEFTGKEGIFLDANENPFGTLNRYPDPYQQQLKSILAAQKGVKKNQLFVGNGSDEVIDLLFRVFCNPGRDKAITFSPTYGMYDVSAAINDVELVKLPLTETFQIDVEAAVNEIQKQDVKLTFVCSPNNPTGNAFPRTDVEELLKNTSGIVVVDEAYIDFRETGSVIDLIDVYPNLVVTQTMSKARGLAAVRVGFAFAKEEIIMLLNKVKPPYNVSGLNQQAAIDALTNNELYESNLKIIIAQREELKQKLSDLNSVIKIYPTDANFLLVEFYNADDIYEELIKRKIIVRNRAKVVKNCIRISVGTPDENNQLITELKQIENEKSIVY